MKKISFLALLATLAMTINAAVEYPAGSGIYYDWDGDGVVYVNWTDPAVLAGDVVFPATITIDGYDYQPQYFGAYATQGTWGNANITSVTIEIPAAVPGWMFEQCTSMTSLTLGDAVTGIGEKAFNGCTSLGAVSFGAGLTSIGESAFWGDPITDVVLPASLTTIGSYVFGGNTAMTSVSFNGVPTAVGEGLFGADYSQFMVGVSYWNLIALKDMLDVAHSGLQYKVWDAQVDETWNNTSYLASCYTDNLVVRRTLPPGVWTPIVIPAWLNASQLTAAFGEGVQIAEPTSFANNVLTFTEIELNDEASIAANTPYLIKVSPVASMPKADGYNIPYVWLSDNYDNLTTTVGDASFVGTLNGYENTVPADAIYIDETGELNISDGTAPLSGMGGYFSSNVNEIVVGQSTITAIETVNVETLADDNRIFDLQGRELSRIPASGIYIMNGKKFIAR